MNVNNSGVPTYKPTSRSDSTHRPSVGLTGQFGGSATRAVPAGHGYSAAASNIAPGLTQGSIQQREVSAARPQLLAQQGKYDLESRMTDFATLAGELADFYSSLNDIPLIASLADDELANIEAGTPAQIIRELKDWSKELKFRFNAPAFDPSQTITAEFAGQALEEFKSKIGKLLSIPDSEKTLKNASSTAAGLLPDIRTNNTVYQQAKSVRFVNDQIAKGQALQRFMDNVYHKVLKDLLPMTQVEDIYQSLKADLDACIRDISYFQANK